MYDSEEFITTIVISIIITIALILILREFWMWYIKRNQQLKNQEEIISLLKKLNNERSAQELHPENYISLRNKNTKKIEKYTKKQWDDMKTDSTIRNSYKEVE